MACNQKARSPWKPTVFNGIKKRDAIFAVYLGRRYVGTYESLDLAKEAAVAAGGDIEKDRSKRESAGDFLVKSQVYLDWVVNSGYEPGDTTAAKELRKEAPYLVRAAPVTYQLAIEGKEAPWTRLLLRAYKSLSAEDKVQLMQLTSNVDKEFMKAAAIQHRIVCTALKGAAVAAWQKQRKWWVLEVNYNVGYHMGWLSKALARKVLVKAHTRGSGVHLGEMNARYRIMPLTRRIAEKYKDMAVLTGTLSLMKVPTTFRDFKANRDALLKMPNKYHDLWYFRSFFELERYATGVKDMPVGAQDTVNDFVRVFPDAVGHLPKLAKHYPLLAQTSLPPTRSLFLRLMLALN